MLPGEIAAHVRVPHQFFVIGPQEGFFIRAAHLRGDAAEVGLYRLRRCPYLLQIPPVLLVSGVRAREPRPVPAAPRGAGSVSW